MDRILYKQNNFSYILSTNLQNISEKYERPMLKCIKNLSILHGSDAHMEKKNCCVKKSARWWIKQFHLLKFQKFLA